MRKKKDWTDLMRGSQLVARGDVIRVMDNGAPVKCRVISCVAVEGGGFVAGLEILEGSRMGETITAKLRAGEDPEPPDTHV